MVDGRHVVTHPDDNLLAAFAERALTPNERERVLEHLSSCARCRDIVFLTQQVFSDTIAGEGRVMAVTPAPGWRRLWWGPAAAGGVLAAALLIVGPVLVYRHWGHSSEKPSQQFATAAPAERAPSALGQGAGVIGAPGALPAVPQVSPARRAVKRAAPPTDLSGRAAIAGSVVDRSGAVIFGAQVTVRAKSSGASRTAVTNAQGQFDLAALPSDDYHVEVQAPGFKMFTQDMAVQPSEQANLDAKLDVGASAETVTVTSGVIGGLATGSGTAGGKIPEREPSAMRMTGRNPVPATASAEATPAPAATPTPPPPTQPVTVSAAQTPLSIGGPSTRGLVVNGAAPVVAFSIKDGAVQRCFGTACVARNLPSSIRAVSAVSSGLTVMALDSDGNLFLSSDQGEHWEQAKVQWFGKAVGLWIEAPGRAESLIGQAKAAPSAGASLHGALAEKQAPLVPTAGVLFHLTNEKGQAWTSSDGGKTWVAK